MRNGGKYYAYEGSYASNLCKNDSGIRNMIDAQLSGKLNGQNNVWGSVRYEIPLNNGDLGAALHNVTLSYVATCSDSGWVVTVCVADTFDFTEFRNPLKEDSFIKGLLWTANDIAYLDSKMGFLQPVDVKIWFSYTYTGG